MAQPTLRVIEGGASTPKDTSGLPPSHDINLEAAMIGAVFRNPGAIDIVSMTLRAEHFFPETHQWIWQAILDVAAEGATPDQVAVGAKLNTRRQLDRCGGANYLEDCALRPAITNLDRQARALFDMWRVRKLSDRVKVLNAETYGRVDDVQAFLDGAAQDVAAIAAKPADGSTVTIQEATREAFKRIEDAAKQGGTLTGLPTGFRELDALTGGWQKREQVILAARPGMGKTAAMMAFSLAVADRVIDNRRTQGVLVFSMEMDRCQLATRVICGEARINNNHLRTGQMGGYKDPWGDLTRAAQWINTLPISIHDTRGMSPHDVRAVARRQIADWKNVSDIELAMIAIDYLQLMKMRGRMPAKSTREEEVAECSRLTRELALELNVPVIVLAALKRGIDKQTDKRPVLADLRESGAIEANADTVIFLHREEYYLKEKCPAEKKREAELIIEKQRNGPPGTARTNYYGPYTLLTDADLGWRQGDDE
jgi:replicative DNA helicase